MAAETASARRAGYARGVIAAGDALMSDLEILGALDDAEVLDRDDGAAVCATCQMRRLGYTAMADRFEFAHRVAQAGAGA